MKKPGLPLQERRVFTPRGSLSLLGFLGRSVRLLSKTADLSSEGLLVKEATFRSLRHSGLSLTSEGLCLCLAASCCSGSGLLKGCTNLCAAGAVVIATLDALTVTLNCRLVICHNCLLINGLPTTLKKGLPHEARRKLGRYTTVSEETQLIGWTNAF